jgi:hypothetical protein
MSELDDKIDLARKAMDAVFEEIRKDDKIEDHEAQAILDFTDEIEDKLADLMSQYGVEIGDERVD